MVFQIDFSPDVRRHMKSLTARQRSIVMDGIEKQLVQEALVETGNRRPMRPNPLAPWELRIGNLRIYYDAVVEPEPLVVVLAVGMKRRNKIYIGGMEVTL